MTEDAAEPDTGFPVNRGHVYLYTGEKPAGRKGHRYLVEDFVVDVPAYQEKVLIRALSGRDRGLRFTCSLANFATRYVPEKKEQPEKVFAAVEGDEGRNP